jgi:hypothetical protein
MALDLDLEGKLMMDLLEKHLKKADQKNICTFFSNSKSSSLANFKDAVIKNNILESL